MYLYLQTTGIFFLWNWINEELTDLIVRLCAMHDIAINPDEFAVQMKGGEPIWLFKEINGPRV